LLHLGGAWDTGLLTLPLEPLEPLEPEHLVPVSSTWFQSGSSASSSLESTGSIRFQAYCISVLLFTPYWFQSRLEPTGTDQAVGNLAAPVTQKPIKTAAKLTHQLISIANRRPSKPTFYARRLVMNHLRG
jgi:hypothetical protein